MGNSAGKFDYETALKNDITLQPTKHFKSFESLGYQDVKTLWELVNAVYKKFPELRFLGRRRIDDDGNLREFVWITYKQGIQTINFLSSGITSLISELGPSEDSDLKTKSNHPDSEQEDDQYMKNFFAYCEDANENIGIYSKNRPEWMLTAIGVHSIKQKAVPLYDTFGQESICFIIGQANLRVVFCSADKVEKLIQAKESGDAASLKIIVQFDYDPKYNNKADMVQTEMVEKSKTAGLRLLGFQQLLRIVF
ncbi:medium-chain fatty acid-CoA ligase faa2, partial [Bonamia ostreae]